MEDLGIFENVAYVMAYHADNSIPELWGENLVTDVTSKKDWQKWVGNDHAAVPSAECGTEDFHPGSGSAHDWAGSGYVDGEIQ